MLNTVRSIANGRVSKLRLVTQDIIIVEDDPYFFLQFREFLPKSRRQAAERERQGDDVSRFIDNLVPSFLKIDTQGRVIRMDTFSKVSPARLRQLRRHTSSNRQSHQGCGSGGLLAARCSQSDLNAWARRQRRTRAGLDKRW